MFRFHQRDKVGEGCLRRHDEDALRHHLGDFATMRTNIAVDLHHLLLAGLPAHLCENTGVQSSHRKSFLDFVSLKGNSAVAAIGKRVIEKTILRLVGS